MSLINKYPRGQWEDPENDQRSCPVCDGDTQVFTVEEVSPTGRAIKYNKGERCLNCGWEVETD